MRCPRCQSENDNDSKFCGNHAAPLNPAGIERAFLTKTLVTPPAAISKDAIIDGTSKAAISTASCPDMRAASIKKFRASSGGPR